MTGKSRPLGISVVTSLLSGVLLLLPLLTHSAIAADAKLASNSKGGRHIKTEDVPLANLWLTLIDMMGLNVEKFGDCEGRLDLISEI